VRLYCLRRPTLTMLAIGPRMGPRVKVGFGASGRYSTFLPRIKTRATAGQRPINYPERQFDELGIEYDTLRKTTELDRMALRALLLPR